MLGVHRLLIVFAKLPANQTLPGSFIPHKDLGRVISKANTVYHMLKGLEERIEKGKCTKSTLIT